MASQRGVILHMPKDFARTAFFVCHLWKNLVSITSTLWVSSVVISSPSDLEIDDISLAESLQVLQSLGDADVDLYVSFSWSRAFRNTPGKWEELVEAIMPYSYRLRVVTWTWSIRLQADLLITPQPGR